MLRTVCVYLNLIVCNGFADESPEVSARVRAPLLECPVTFLQNVSEYKFACIIEIAVCITDVTHDADFLNVYMTKYIAFIVCI